MALTQTAAAPATTAAPWERFADQALAGEQLSIADGLRVLRAPDHELLALLHAVFRVRRHHFGVKIKLNMLINAKSGHCAEDCGYCSQSKLSSAAIPKYPIVDKETILAGAREALNRQAGTYCIVCSGRGPTPKTMDVVTEAVREIKATMPLKICACLGLLKPGQAARLKAAGVDRYNHNLNTSARHHDAITHTHGYDDRVDTLAQIKAAGISPCSGIIVGMGESEEDLVDVAIALREFGAASIPVNFLVPIAGTPLAAQTGLNPRFCLKVLALFRFYCPDREIRVAGGREVHLRSLQPLAFYAANSVFVGDYLTTPGQAPDADHQMIADLGFEIERYAVPHPAPATCGTAEAEPVAEAAACCK